MSRLDIRKKEILDAIDRLFGDTSIPLEDCLIALEEVAEELGMKIGALEDDIRRIGDEREE